MRARRLLVVLILGFSSGLPISLLGATLQAWMTQAQVDIRAIGAFALVGSPYTWKFVWSPLMVRFAPPFLGPRRGWMIICQAAIACTLMAMAHTNPAVELKTMALLAVCLAFFSASQDIVIDGYRTEILDERDLGTGASLAIFGYRVAMLVSGALALILRKHLEWSQIYLLMAALMGVGAAAAIAAPEPERAIPPPKSLREAVLEPLQEFLGRTGAVEMLMFIVLYKLGDVLALALQTTFLLSLGYSTDEIGKIAKVIGLSATIIGSLAGGPLMERLGMRRGLVIFGFIQGLSIVSFSLLAAAGYSIGGLTAAIAFENFCSGLGNAAFIAFLMSLCRKELSTTQYALLTSLGAIPRVFTSSVTGFIVKAIGWKLFFCLCALASVPGLLLLIMRFDTWNRVPEPHRSSEPC